ncbi:type IV pilus assembly protein PilE [Luteibacter sp. HA06]|jgi:type IV pilus assembly protein PilE
MPALDRRRGGFTLLELMIVLMVMGVLAAIAITSYGRYGIRARRADGQKLLMGIANAEEGYFALHNAYADLATIGYSTTSTATSEGGYYTASVTVSTVNTVAAQAYLATATPVPGNSQARDACAALTLTSVGVTGASGGTTNGTCW